MNRCVDFSNPRKTSTAHFCSKARFLLKLVLECVGRGGGGEGGERTKAKKEKGEKEKKRG
ncbi:hypothetical protein BKN38_08955 [Helicobacter sp. CLO-3]|nr:hypothetical protein BA723_07870 [Helicobacter sp. CLO-3]OHU81489.1 hypothetical protein BKN38_08955 [Helicobacter sp. CLO-3]